MPVPQWFRGVFHAWIRICLLLALWSWMAGCTGGGPVLRISCADALAGPMESICREFSAGNPGVRIETEYQGSVLLCRLAALRPCDVLVVSDARLVRRFLPDSGWVAPFAHDELVLAWSEKSAAYGSLTSSSWADVLVEGKLSIGMEDPSIDPCGYYTLLCWKLYDRLHGLEGRFYSSLLAAVPASRRMQTAVSTLAHLQGGGYDCAFIYRQLALSHALPFLRLPPRVNLGDPALAAEYASAALSPGDGSGVSFPVQGAPVTFGVTIPPSSSSRRWAERFVRFLLSPAALRILARSGVRVPDRVDVVCWKNSALPPGLGSMAVRGVDGASVSGGKGGSGSE